LGSAWWAGGKETTMTQPTEITHTDSDLPVVYQFTVEELRAKLAPLKDLTFDSPRAYEAGRQAIAECRTTRVAV
jgi:hypothetical protein